MITASARSSVLAYGMLLAVCCTMVTANSPYTQSWAPADPGMNGVKLELQPSVQPGDDFKVNVLDKGIKFEASLVRVTLPPCGVRTMHIHRNVDEIHYVVDGTFTASLHIPADNSIVTDTITEGQSFLAPANYVHELINPSCDKTATFMGFYNKLDAAITNIAPAAYDLAGSPFKAYQDQSKSSGLEAAASGYFALDPTCLATCNICTPPTAYTPPTTTYSPPTETYSPPTETYSPPTATYTPPTETYSPPTETYSPPPITYSPPPTTYSPPPRTYSPPPTTYSPPTETYSPPTETYSPPPRTYSPPPTTYSPPTETHSPPTETYSPPTTTYSPPTETYSPPTETYSPPTETYSPPPTTYSPPPRTYSPPPTYTPPSKTPPPTYTPPSKAPPTWVRRALA